MFDVHTPADRETRTNQPTDRPTSQREQRADNPVFDAVVEVEGGGEQQALFTVVRSDVAFVVDNLLSNGWVSRPEIRAPLGSDDGILNDTVSFERYPIF